MADRDGNRGSKEYYVNIPQEQYGFHVKGAAHTEWGLKNRLARMFDKGSGNTVMLAFDHGYIMGPTSGLERLDITVPPLIPHVDVLMTTRGAFRGCIDPAQDKPIALRVNYDSSVLFDDMSDGGGLAVDIRDAVRINASCIVSQTFIGAPGERRSLETLSRVIDAGIDYGIPVMGVVAVGKQMERTEQFFLLATRILAELGVHIVKSYYCDGFERIASQCPVPIVIAGGKKLPEDEALTMAYRAISEGAHGVDMGRNIFQAKDPVAMCKAVRKVVHEGYTDREAYEYFLAESENQG
jgi:putative autoinducer-2 (AI-2) aldolase